MLLQSLQQILLFRSPSTIHWLCNTSTKRSHPKCKQPRNWNQKQQHWKIHQPHIWTPRKQQCLSETPAREQTIGNTQWHGPTIAFCITECRKESQGQTMTSMVSKITPSQLDSTTLVPNSVTKANKSGSLTNNTRSGRDIRNTYTQTSHRKINQKRMQTCHHKS